MRLCLDAFMKIMFLDNRIMIKIMFVIMIMFLEKWSSVESIMTMASSTFQHA